MSDMDDIVREFLVECHESVASLDKDLVELEEDPGNREILATIFRSIHTIKGTCSFLGFDRLEEVTHAGENLLSRLRDGELSLDRERTDVLLALVDAVREILASIEEDGSEGDGDYRSLTGSLHRLQEDDEDPGVGDGGPTPSFPDQEVVAEDDPPPIDPGGVQQGEGGEPPEDPVILLDDPALERASPPPSPPLPSKDAGRGPASAGRQGAPVAGGDIRVRVRLLDKLMNLVGELVLARNQILQFSEEHGGGVLAAAAQHLDLVTTELQEAVMATRMQPIGRVWRKFPRLVRDLSSTCGKPARIQMSGEDTELDRTLIEAITDPLTHLIRNAIDHGIEPPEARERCGKPPEGHIRLRAYHEGGQVNIELEDDGAGIDPQLLRQKAVEKRLLTPEQVARFSDREMIGMIFAPGFSTSTEVTNVSGRGVGLDVLRTNIDRIGGSIDIHSSVGEGTSLKIKIPLTLAIIPALLVSSRGGRYAIPQVNLVELVRLTGEEAERGLEEIQGVPVYRLRGRLLPIVDLDRVLGGAPLAGSTDPEACSPRAIHIVVLEAEEQQFGLIVDGVHDSAEIVVKPLSSHLNNIPAFAGATILGDGNVAIILDVLGIAQSAGVVSTVGINELATSSEAAPVAAEDREALLVVGLGERGRAAIPLSHVTRLEEFPAAVIERTGGRQGVLYRGEMLPLLRLPGTLPAEGGSVRGEDPLHVLVYSEGGRSVGLVVERFFDIVEEAIELRRPTPVEGAIGTVVIEGRLTELLDLREIVRMLEPELLEEGEIAEKALV
ncbi:MAG: chemotaxis protein CheW [Planctomycetota bacterium]